MTHNRIERLERDLVARSRRRGRRDAMSARPRDTAECPSRAFSADHGDAISLLCDRPSRGYGAGMSYVNAFDAVEAVDIDAGPSIDDPTTSGAAVPSTPDASADPTTASAESDPTTTGVAVDPTRGTGTADPTNGLGAMADLTIERRPPSPSLGPAATAAPPRVATAPDDLQGWQVTNEAPDQETALAQDVAAILAHTRGDDMVHTPAPTPAPSSPPQVQAPAPAAPQMGIGATSSHDVFDRMADANRYDQCSFTLSGDFAAMDQAIDRGQATEPPSAPAAPANAATPAVPAPAPGDASPPAAPGHESTTTPDSPPSADVADAAAVDAITAASGPFRVTTDVPLVAQVPGLSCHAAACASIVAWRDDVTPVPAEVAAATGYWERYAEGRTAVYPDVLDAFGLSHSVMGPAPSATGLKDLIERAGPLWISASPPGERAVVVSGITGDGTTSGTMVDVVDPWARGMTTYGSPNPGSSYHQSLADLLAGVAGGAGKPLVIAQLKEGPAR
jgi:hypothetical protein